MFAVSILTVIATLMLAWIAREINSIVLARREFLGKLDRRVEKLEYRDMYYAERDTETFNKLQKLTEDPGNFATNASITAMEKRVQQLAELIDTKQDK